MNLRSHIHSVFLNPDDHIDVTGQIIVLSPLLVLVETEDVLMFHHLEVLDHRLGTDGQPFGDLSDKAGFLPQELDDPPPISISQDVQNAGIATIIKHVYFMLVMYL
jgi:hypothetical protein